MIELKHPASGLERRALTPGEQELVVSSTVAAAALGSYLSGQLQRTPYVGRRGAIMHASVWFVLGALLMAVSGDLATLILGRVLVGASVGLVSHAVPLYIAETSAPQFRGALSAMNNVMIVLGQVISSLVCCYYAARDSSSGDSSSLRGWRWMLGWGVAPAALLFVGMMFLPESPRWLLQVGKDSEKALSALVWLRGSEKPAALELDELTPSSAAEHVDKVADATLMGNLCKPRTRRALQLGLALQLLQQTTGINTIMYYSATILQMTRGSSSIEAGCAVSRRLMTNQTLLSSEDVHDVCWTAPIALSQLIGTIIGMFLVDSVGRRPITLLSLLMVGVSMCALGAAFYPDEANSTLAIGGMCTYLITFGIGLAPIPWIVNAEIYPFDTRGAAIGVTTATNWIANFLVAATFLDLVRVLSTDRECPSMHPDGAFWLYGLIAFVGFFWLFIYMPETRGKTLEEIDKLFD
eukprot:TRINITY_DN26986_c0_g1_i1.p1 TRINITY_DN26986_c0_g1~~TRINITY_DN26986_c0_g1_i1.p1  ORF type:complete len:467 (+),score=58.75 TRINITY_DN26986_c0_g1_i1:232-1632(+)